MITDLYIDVDDGFRQINKILGDNKCVSLAVYVYSEENKKKELVAWRFPNDVIQYEVIFIYHWETVSKHFGFDLTNAILAYNEAE